MFFTVWLYYFLLLLVGCQFGELMGAPIAFSRLKKNIHQLALNLQAPCISQGWRSSAVGNHCYNITVQRMLSFIISLH